MAEKKCPKCDYKWIPRTSNPKSCPRCKQRIDYTPRIKRNLFHKIGDIMEEEIEFID